MSKEDRMFQFSGARGEDFTDELKAALNPFLHHAKMQRVISALGANTPHISKLPEETCIRVGPHVIYIPYHSIMVDGDEMPESQRFMYPLPDDAPRCRMVWINDARNALIHANFSFEEFDRAMEEIKHRDDFAQLYAFFCVPE
jgi:hypothetical protein